MMGRDLKPLRAQKPRSSVSLAKHYRDLNQPEDAESICRDILDVAPDNEEARARWASRLPTSFQPRG